MKVYVVEGNNVKALMISLIAGAAGIAALLSGLGIDAWLHAEDPTLAQREGIFTLTNPGHALLALGVLLTCAGVLAALHMAWGMAQPRGLLGATYVRAMSMHVSALACVGAVVFALAVSSSGHDHALAVAGVEHEHDGGVSRDHDAADAPDVSPEAQVAAPIAANAADGPMHSHDDAANEMAAAVTPRAHVHDGAMAAPATGPAAGVAHEHALVNATSEEIACGNDLVRRTQEATARFADYDAALAEGYRPNPANPTGNHYGNRAYRLDGEFMNLERPETLIYYTNKETGEKALIGVMFLMPRGQAGPQPCGSVTSWHTHANCINLETREATPVDHGATCAAGYRYAESTEMMHVWFIPGRKNGVAPLN